MSGGRLISLLALAATRLSASAFSGPACKNASLIKLAMSSASSEVDKAKEAAVAYKSSDADGAGPATLLRRRHPLTVYDCSV